MGKQVEITRRSCNQFALPGLAGANRQAQIAERAFELWLARGFRDGSPQEDWLRAVLDLREPAQRAS
jgi:hypothetical protein